jgi:sterol 14-demethylase
MFISMMFAGHHTTSGTSAWTLLELLLNPGVLQRVVEELDSLYADGREVSYQALREIPELECSLKETLRLHPPLIILMRKVMEELEYKDYVIEEGVTVAVSPAISNRMPEHFPEPERFDPERYKPGREEDKQSFAWLPFGAGRHRCVGAAFAMVQLKAIFSVLLRSFEFELAQPKESYHNDHSKMVVTLKQPCRVRYRRRAQRTSGVSAADPASAPAARSAGARVSVDADLCQGHGVCAAECPEIFAIDDEAMKVRLLREDVPAELREKAEAAVRYCPTHALRIQDDRGD